MILGLLRSNLVIIFSACTAGCAVQNVADPANISLEKALVDTVDALAAANARGKQRHTRFGFYGCSVTAVYNISATATQDNKLGLTAAGPAVPIVPIAYTGSLTSQATATGTRGNTVTVVLNTPYCMPNARAAPSGKSGPVIPVFPPS